MPKTAATRPVELFKLQNRIAYPRRSADAKKPEKVDPNNWMMLFTPWTLIQATPHSRDEAYVVISGTSALTRRIS